MATARMGTQLLNQHQMTGSGVPSRPALLGTTVWGDIWEPHEMEKLANVDIFGSLSPRMVHNIYQLS